MTAITDQIHITSIETVQESPTSDFSHIITVCQDEVSDNISNSCEYHHINLADGKTNRYEGGTCSYELFREAVQTLEKAIKNGSSVLIHCHAGISRSPSVAAAAIGNQNNTTFEEALSTIRTERPIVNPADTLREYGQKYIETEDSP